MSHSSHAGDVPHTRDLPSFLERAEKIFHTPCSPPVATCPCTWVNDQYQALVQWIAGRIATETTEGTCTYLEGVLPETPSPNHLHTTKLGSQRQGIGTQVDLRSSNGLPWLGKEGER